MPWKFNPFTGNFDWTDAGGGGGGVTIKEIDGTPSIAGVTTLEVNNASLTDLGGGTARLNIGVHVDGGSYLDAYVASDMDVDGGSY